MYAIGVMPMPAGFKYRDVCLKGKPRHERWDAFRVRHPQMPPAKRAKIFAPFDALRGFDFAILMKNEIYTDRAGLSPQEREELDRRFAILHNLTCNSRMARANRVQVTVTYFEACSDVNSEAYGLQGQYKTITGICLNVDAEVTRTILVDVTDAPRTGTDGLRIPLEDIRTIESPGKLFETRWL